MMASDEDALALLALPLIMKKKETKPVKRKRKKWCKDWLLKRATYSHVNLNLLNELKFEPEDFKNYPRMDEKHTLNYFQW